MSLALDAIDDAFKSVIEQLTRNAEEGTEREFARQAVIKIRKARVQMIEWMSEPIA
jgi:hypothetical protein